MLFHPAKFSLKSLSILSKVLPTYCALHMTSSTFMIQLSRFMKKLIFLAVFHHYEVMSMNKIYEHSLAYCKLGPFII